MATVQKERSSPTGKHTFFGTKPKDPPSEKKRKPRKKQLTRTPPAKQTDIQRAAEKVAQKVWKLRQQGTITTKAERDRLLAKIKGAQTPLELQNVETEVDFYVRDYLPDAQYEPSTEEEEEPPKDKSKQRQSSKQKSTEELQSYETYMEDTDMSDAKDNEDTGDTDIDPANIIDPLDEEVAKLCIECGWKTKVAGQEICSGCFRNQIRRETSKTTVALRKQKRLLESQIALIKKQKLAKLAKANTERDLQETIKKLQAELKKELGQ